MKTPKTAFVVSFVDIISGHYKVDRVFLDEKKRDAYLEKHSEKNQKKEYHFVRRFYYINEVLLD